MSEGHRAGGEPGPEGAAAFLGQLSAPEYTLDLRRPATAGVGSTAPSPGTLPAAGVLLLSRSSDVEFGAVAKLLGGAGIPAVRVNADDLAGADLLVDPAGGAVRVNGRWLRPTVAWLRHFSAQAIEGSGAPAHDMFLRESWATVAEQLLDVSAIGLRSHRPGVLAQLRIAERNGLAVPRTVLSADPYQALDLLPSTRMVIKAAHQHFVEAVPGSLTGVFPVIVDRDDLAPLPRPGPPVIVQEFVEHEAELRVYHVDGQVVAFQISKDAPSDLWLRGDRVRARVVEPDPKVVQAATLLASELSLRYCAFDFLIRDGVPVFLEVNPDGDWSWIESKAGATPVTAAVARMLCDLHRTNLPASPEGGGRGSGSFDLLAFLTSGGK